MTTTSPFEPAYLDELDLRRELAAAFDEVLSRPDTGGGSPWLPALETVIAQRMGGRGGGAFTARDLSPAEQDAVVDGWARVAVANGVGGRAHGDDPAAPGPGVRSEALAALGRRALQVRVRNEGLTPRQWVDRTFAGRRARWCRALVRSFGTTAGLGSCRCLDQPLVGTGSLVAGWQCCGSPWLDNGDLERFIRRARRNVALLDAALDTGPAQPVLEQIVEPIDDPVCRSVVTDAYLTYVGGPATERVVAAYRR